MKIKLYPYNKNSPELYNKEKQKIIAAFKNLGKFKVYHIGSTSVPGLGGKGIIDIIVAVKNWAEAKAYISRLKKIGFKHIHREEKGRIFLSRIRQTKKGDIHIHLVRQKSPELLRHLKFRAFLRTHNTAAQRYWQTKLKLIEATKGKRKLFGKLKGSYIQSLNRNF